MMVHERSKNQKYQNPLHNVKVVSEPTDENVRRICTELREEYGLPMHWNPSDPLDDLVYIIISTRSRIATAAVTFELLQKQFSNWAEILERPDDLVCSLKPMGLSTIKGAQLLGIVARLQLDFGEVTLNRLRDYDAKSAEKYLISLPGVSHKIAKCVMMYTLGFQVLPVDTNVHRIATRLGWTKKRIPEQSQHDLERLVPAELRFAFHVDAISHGNLVCRPRNPDCTKCIISNDCLYFQVLRNP